jgi:uncharacterized protein YndB with AHSA1/START domain
METTLNIDIDAPPEIVFHWVTVPLCVSQWLAHLSEFELINATEPAAGVKFKQTWDDEENSELHGEITEYTLNERYSIAVAGKGFDAQIQYRLTDIDGKTRLRQKTNFDYKGVMKMIEKIAGGKIRRSYQDEAKRNLAALVDHCEAQE